MQNISRPIPIRLRGRLMLALDSWFVSSMIHSLYERMPDLSIGSDVRGAEISSSTLSVFISTFDIGAMFA